MSKHPLHRFLFSTLRGRLILGVAVINAVIMLLFAGDLMLRQRAMLLDRQAEGATALSQALSTSAAGWIMAQDVSGLQELVDAQLGYPEVLFAIITDEQGRVLAATDRTRRGQHMLDVPRDPRLSVISRSPELVDVAAPATLQGRHVGWARVGIGQKAAADRMAQLVQSSAVYALSAIVLGSLVAWLMGRWITARLYTVQATINSVRSGDIQARSSLAGNDEAALMAREFNGMLDAIAERDAERKRAEEATGRLNRELIAISACNQALLHAEDERTLLEEICRIICEQAGYRLAWVGYAEQDAARTVRPVARAGFDEGYVDGARVSWGDDSENGRRPAGAAIRTGSTVYVQDLSDGARSEPWRGSALDRGYRSSIALPLKDQQGAAFGVLVIYATDVDAFTPGEIRLLEELAGDLAFGIISLRTREERKRAEDALQEEKRLFIGGPSVAFRWRATEGWPVEYVSPNVEQQFGYTPEALLSGRVRYSDIVHPDDLTRVAQEVDAFSRQGVACFEQEYRIARSDGQFRWVYDFTVVVRDPNGLITHYQGHITDITERRRTVRDLVLMNFALDNVKEAAFLIDDAGRFELVNEEACRVLGYTRAELLGLGVSQVDPDFPEGKWPEHWNELKSSRSRVFEGRHRTREGRIFPVEINANYFEYDGKGYNLALARDITERKRAEAALQHLNRELKAISNCNEALLRAEDEQILLNELCRIVCEEAGYKLAWVGYAERDEASTVRPAAWAGEEDGYLAVSGLTWADTDSGNNPAGLTIRSGQTTCIPEVATAPFARAWQQSSLQRGYRSGVALPLKNESGEVFGVLCIYSTEPNAVTPEELRLLEELSGDLAYGIVALRTRAERERAEATLRKVSRAVEQSPASIIITDTRGNIEYVNPKFTEASGYAPSEVLGRNPRLLKSGATPPEEYRRLWQTITSGKVWRGEFENRKKTGEPFFELASISPIFDASGVVTHFVAVKEDTTQRRRLEEEFRQAQKLEAVGQLAGGVAHDFNNILAAILLNLSLLMDDETLSADAKSSLEDLQHAANRAIALTRQLLLFSRRQVMDAKPLDLSSSVSSMTRMLRRLIGEDIDLVFQGRGDGLWVKADAGMIDQVLMNLCVNARDAMPHGGKLTIASRRVEVDAERAATMTGARAGSFVCLSVTDTGCGMDEQTMRHIFEPFFTTKEVGKGTGLGLATVHGIVKQHHGWIQAESSPGNGAAFHVYLPAFLEEEQPLAAPESLEVRGGTECILVVEDDVSLRRLEALGLRRLGYTVCEAADGNEALKQWGLHRDEIGILLTDMVMPGGLSGLDLAERLMDESDSLSVIVTSGYTTERARAETLKDRGIIYLPKPYDVAELARTVRGCLDLARRHRADRSQSGVHESVAQDSVTEKSDTLDGRAAR